MKKILSFILPLLIVLSVASCGLFEDGYLYVGDGWQDTPEKALAIAADNPMDEDILTVRTHLDTWHVGDRAYMLFVSESDMLVEAEFVTNEKGQYHYHGYSAGSPDEFLFDAERIFGEPYVRHGTLVWGYKLSSVKITVGGAIPETKTYAFMCGGEEWSIDRFFIDGVGENAEIVKE